MPNLPKITASDIKSYLDGILNTSTSSTYDRKLSSLRKFFSWAQKQGYFQENAVEDYLNQKENLIISKVVKAEQLNNQAIDKPSQPFYQSIQARLVSRFEGKPRIQNFLFKAFYSRPQWYKTYHSISFTRYFHFAILTIFSVGLVLGIYDQFRDKTTPASAYPTSLVTPKRYLSFQGRLTNQYGNPVTEATNITFKLWNHATDATEVACNGGGDENCLWSTQTPVCSVDPDDDGIFNVLLGTTSGNDFTCAGATEITSDVFSENAEVWLGVKVASDDEATPRIQIATVAYALNAETLQGYPITATGSATKNSVVTMNNGGEIVIGETAPKIKSVSGNFLIQGEAMTLSTPDTSNGSVDINPDGTGTLNLTFEGAAAGGGVGGFINAANANITSGALYSGQVASDATGYDFIQFKSGSSPTEKFAVDNAGDVTLADLVITGGNINPSAALTLGDGGDTMVIDTSDWDIDATGAMTNMSFDANGTGNSITNIESADIADGTIAEADLKAVDSATDEECLTYEETTGDFEWQTCGSVAGTNYWQLNSEVLSPYNTTLDLAIGGTATDTAKFVVNANTGNIITAGDLALNGGDITSTGALTITPAAGSNLNIALSDTGDLAVNTDQLYVDTSEGFIGIGLTNPSTLLHVTGSIYTGNYDETNAVASFVNTINNDGIGVYGESASTDFYGYGGVFKGGYVGTHGFVEPTGSEYYVGVMGGVDGGTGGNVGVEGFAYNGNNVWGGTFSGNAYAEEGETIDIISAYGASNVASAYAVGAGASINIDYAYGTYTRVYNDLSEATSSNIENAYGLYVAGSSVTGGATIEDNYGIYIGNQTVGSTSNYSIYSAGGANYFGGNITTAGDLYLNGDDLFMGTNTDTYILVADGTNFNPVAMSGDVTITNTGATAIGDNKIVEADLKAVDSASDEECLTYEVTTGDFEWQACGSGGGGDSYWALSDADGTLYPVNETLDVLFGGTATNTAKIGLINLAGGTPTINLANQASNIAIKDNTASALQILEGANPYLSITTSDDTEKISFGNTTTNPDYHFLGTGKVGIGTNSPASSLDIVGGAIASEGSDKVTNGAFSADSDWIKGTGWTISGETANKSAGTASDLEQNISVSASKMYKITFDYTRTAGNLTVALGGVTHTTTFSSASGSPEIYIFTTGTENLKFQADSSFAGTVDNVIVKEVSTSLANTTFRDSDSNIKNELRIAGTRNIFLGYKSGQFNTTGENNYSLGYNALYSNTTGYENIALGSYALQDNTEGYQNIALGYNALEANTTGYRNIALGYKALEENTTGQMNIALGYHALQLNINGYSNIALGQEALETNTEGFHNVALGQQALNLNTTGYQNIALGYSALEANTEGYNNVALGYKSLESNTSGDYNVALGYYALNTNTTTNYNIALGRESLLYSQTGAGNISLGYRSGGYGTGTTFTGADYNTILGYQAGYNLNTNMDGNVYIGYQAGYSATGDDQLYIANSSTTSLVYGDFSSGQMGIGGTAAHTNPSIYISSGGSVGIGDISPAATLTVGDGDLFQVAGATGNITTAGDLAVNGGDITSTATDFNITIANAGTFDFIAGANTLMALSDQGTTGRLAISDSLQVGSLTPVAYSRFGTTATSHAANLTTSNDLLIGADGANSGDLEIDGLLFLDGGEIYNSLGNSVISLTATPTTTQNILQGASWKVNNEINVGLAALTVDQQHLGDLFTASKSGTPKFTIHNDGSITLAGMTSTSNTQEGTIYYDTDIDRIYLKTGYYTPPGFTGSGLNDLTVGGTYSGASPLDYKVEIDGTGTPDTFKWSDDGGITWDASTVSITGSAQTLNNGVTVTFGATTGHTSTNNWVFKASPSSWSRLATDMTKYSSESALIANQSYVEIAHFQNTFDISLTGWFFDTVTSLWKKITDWTSLISHDLDNEFNPDFTQKLKTDSITINDDSTYFGTGTDGDITISADTDINITNSISGRSCAQGGDAVNYSVLALTSTTAKLFPIPAAGCLVAGDEVLLINQRGIAAAFMNVGNYETLNIESISGDTITFSTDKTKFYGDTLTGDANISTGAAQLVMVQRVPNYNDVTVNTGINFTPDGFDITHPTGDTAKRGGVMAFRANGTVTITGTIHADAKGYEGGANAATNGTGGAGGESFCGAGGAAAGGAGAAGGGGNYSASRNGGAGSCGGGGGGGSDDGTNGTGGTGSATQGGAGGGGGAAEDGTANGYGYDGDGGSGGYGTPGESYGNYGGINSSGNGTAGTTGGTILAHGGDGGGGGTYGDPKLNQIFFGSAGGASGDGETGTTTWVQGESGGNGGGIVIISAKTVNVGGSISSAGAVGIDLSTASGEPGSGAGGSIKITADDISINSEITTPIDIQGGKKATGHGRLYIEHVGSITTPICCNWAEQQPAGNVDKTWYGADISGDKMIAAAYQGRLYYYDGSSWSETRPLGDADKYWKAVAISGDKMIVTEINVGRLYYYDGSSWAETQPAGDVAKSWNVVGISGDKMIAGANAGRLYYYDGSSWAEQQPAGDADANWRGVGISGDKMIAGIDGGRLYYYNGSSWAEQQPAGDADKDWTTASISGDKMIAGLSGGRLYYYDGSSWAEIQPVGDVDKYWLTARISGDKMIAAPASPKRIHTFDSINYTNQLIAANNYSSFVGEEINTPDASAFGNIAWTEDLNTDGEIQVQTRSGATPDSTDGSWEGWKPVVNNTNEVSLSDLDSGDAQYSETNITDSDATSADPVRNINYFEDEDLLTVTNKYVQFDSVGSEDGYAEDTITSTDLTNYDYITAWVYATGSGNLVNLGFGETTGNEQEEGVILDAASTWQKVYWDITDVAAASKDGVTKIRVSLPSTNSTVYVDDIKAGRYLTTNSGSAITSTANDYIQYRFILSTTTPTLIPTLSDITVGYTNPSGAFTIDADRLRVNDNSYYFQNNDRLSVVETNLDEIKSTNVDKTLTSVDQRGDYNPGTGADGAITVSGDTNINTTTSISGRSAVCGDAPNYSVISLTPTTATLTTTPDTANNCLVPGDEILLINLRGTVSAYGNLGNYETLHVGSISGNTITFTTSKTNYYGDGLDDDTNIGTLANTQKVMLQRVPNYTDVTVNASMNFYPSDFDDSKGGVMFFRSTGTVTINGNITSEGTGYAGGITTESSGSPGSGGEAFCMDGVAGGVGGTYGEDGTAGTCGGGGGGGISDSDAASGGAGSASFGGAGGGGGSAADGTASGYTAGGGGGGGGYATGGKGGLSSTPVRPYLGEDGGINTSGDGGDAISHSATASRAGGGGGGGTYGDNDNGLTNLYFGSGGGSGGSGEGMIGEAGGAGGGILYIAANSITVSGTLSAKGDNGTEYVGGGYNYGGGGGGGAGGSIKLLGNSINVGSSNTTSIGGSTATENVGNGGLGKIAVYYADTLSGTTSPLATEAEVPYYNYSLFISDEIETPNSTAYNKIRWLEDLEGYGMIQFQTRSGLSNNSTDGTWETWKPVTTDTNTKSLSNMDTGDSEWSETNITDSDAASPDPVRNVDFFEDEDLTTVTNKYVQFDSVGSSNGYAEDTITSADLTNYDYLTAWVYSTRSGNIVTLGFGESAGNEQEETFHIDATNTWQKLYWDITDIEPGLKNAVTKLRVSILNTNTTLYLDNVTADRYLSDSAGSTITSTPNKYIQYRAILTTTNDSYRPKLHNVQVEWSNGFKIVQTDANTVRLYNFTGDSQQLRLDAVVFGADLAEWYTVNDDSIEPGDLVSITGEMDEFGVPVLRKSNQINDSSLLGVISTTAGKALGIEAPNRRLLALAGRVPAKIDPDSAEIKAGDYLTSSSLPGYARKATSEDIAIGRAFENWHPSMGRESILVYVENSPSRDYKITDSKIFYIANNLVNGVWEVIDQETGKVFEGVGAFAEVIAANITAGSIVTKEFTTDSFLAFQGTIDNLIVSSGMMTPSIKTEVISPIADGNITIDLENTATDSAEPTYGKLAIKGEEGKEVVSIDASGNATFSGTLESDQVKTNDLYAGKIYADEIVARNGNFAEISSASESTITREEIEEMLKEAEDNLANLSSFNEDSLIPATNSANLNELALENLFITDTLAASSLSISNSLTLGNDLVFQTSKSEDGTILANSIDTLSAPLQIQSLAMAPLEIMAGKIRIETNGNVFIDGNIYVAGVIQSEGLTLAPSQEVIDRGFGDLLSIKDFEGRSLATIDASGSAKFNEVSTNKVIIAGNIEDQETSTMSGNIQTNATAGKAIIPAGTNEITITNPNVTNYTLTYVTPTSSTQNNVLYVKAKNDGYFTVGFNQALDIEVSFNWWVIDLRANN